MMSRGGRNRQTNQLHDSLVQREENKYHVASIISLFGVLVFLFLEHLIENKMRAFSEDDPFVNSEVKLVVLTKRRVKLFI